MVERVLTGREPLRLFVAVELPEAMRDALAARVGEVRDGFPKARWVRPDALHLTVLFLGDTPPSKVPALCEAFREAVAAVPGPLELALGPADAFPPRGRARTLFLEVGEGQDGGDSLARLGDLHDRLVFRDPASRERDKRPFSPHLTLARMRPPWKRGDVDRFREELGDTGGGGFTVREAVLFSSDLRPDGACHTRVETFILGEGSG